MKSTQQFYKLTNTKESHNAFKYKDGLNTDFLPFNTTGSCCAGGLYFSNAKNILDFIQDNRWIRKVSIPKGETQWMKNPNRFNGDMIKWRSHSLFCEPRKDLFKVDTWKWIINEGIKIDYVAINFLNDNKKYDIIDFIIRNPKAKLSKADIDHIFAIMVKQKNLKTAKYMLSQKRFNVSVGAKELAVFTAVYDNNLDLLKYLLNSANIKLSKDRFDEVFNRSIHYGNTSIIKFLLECKKYHVSDDVIKYVYENRCYIKSQVTKLLKPYYTGNK